MTHRHSRAVVKQGWLSALPAPAKVVVIAVAVVVGLVLLVVLFEWAGDLLDTGGVIG